MVTESPDLSGAQFFRCARREVGFTYMCTYIDLSVRTSICVLLCIKKKKENKNKNVNMSGLVGFDYVSFRLRVLWMEYGEKAHTHYAFLVMELKLTRTNSIFFF
jgi:hypothetical protein